MTNRLIDDLNFQVAQAVMFDPRVRGEIYSEATRELADMLGKCDPLSEAQRIAEESRRRDSPCRI